MTTEANSPAVALFQRVHGKMVMLQRLDAQLAGLIEQRRKVQSEIQNLQGQINEEIDRQLRQADELPARILAEIAETSRGIEERPYAPSRLSSEVERAEASLSAAE